MHKTPHIWFPPPQPLSVPLRHRGVNNSQGQPGIFWYGFKTCQLLLLQCKNLFPVTSIRQNHGQGVSSLRLSHDIMCDFRSVHSSGSGPPEKLQFVFDHIKEVSRTTQPTLQECCDPYEQRRTSLLLYTAVQLTEFQKLTS